MDQKKVIKQMIDLNKSAFDKAFSAVSVLQDQADKMYKMWLEQNKALLPAEAKKAIADWVKNYKKLCDDFKSKVDDGYKKMEEYFGAEK